MDETPSIRFLVRKTIAPNDLVQLAQEELIQTIDNVSRFCNGNNFNTWCYKYSLGLRIKRKILMILSYRLVALIVQLLGYGAKGTYLI